MNFSYFVLLVQVLVLSVSASSSQSLPQFKFSPFDSPDFCSQIITPTCNTTFSYIDDVNKAIRPSMRDLIKTSYFRYFKVNLDKQCKFWNAQHFCATENCAVEILSPEQYNWTKVKNENLNPSKLGKIERVGSTARDGALETEEPETCEDLDYSHIDDDHQCVYVNLLENPERFTGYGGNQSFDVWKAIYSENCFPNTNPMSMIGEEKEQCIEKNLFYRLVSGLHASIAVHLSNEYLEPETGEFYPNLQVFMNRVGSFNDRLANIYFNYALVAQSLVRLAEVLPLKEFIHSGYDDISPAQQKHLLESNVLDPEEKYDDLLLNDIIPALASNSLFNTSTLFDPSSVDPKLKDEFRARFKNISAIMDCVGCDRCRMWGKIQTIGYGTALKILFESEDPKNHDILKFRRIEIVALLNTFDRLSKSVEAINNFKSMYLEHLEDVKKGLAKPGDYETKHSNKGGFDFPFFSTPDSSASSKGSESTVAKKRLPPQPKKTSEGSNKLYYVESEKLYDASKRTFSDEFKIAANEVWDALKFVLLSYKELPANLAEIALSKLITYWNLLIGKQVVFDYKSEVPLVDEQQQYDQLFSE
ncbi:hypothetical protein G9P44_003017 [Scheffersomyces stipitis]|nr:hypothetical protein G9P44_003017 [Scheffersomyces stipitis]